MTAKTVNVATLNAMLAALGFAPATQAKAATKAAPIKASKATVTPIKTSKAAKKIAVKTTISDADLLKTILKMPDEDKSSAFKVMIVLRQQNIASSRVRIRRVIAEWEASKAAKTATKKAKR